MATEDEEDGADVAGETLEVGQLDTSIEYTGKVKSLNMRVGHGYIECEDVKEAVNQDVYVHQNTLVDSGAHVNDIVQFMVHLNHKGLPQAQSPLTVVEKGEPAQYRGSIKSFVSSSGYGFVACSETMELYGRDCYLPGSKFEGFDVGQEVLFDVDLNADMPVVQRMYPAVITSKGKAAKGKAADGKGKAGKAGKGKPAEIWSAAEPKGKPSWKGAGKGKVDSGWKASNGAKAWGKGQQGQSWGAPAWAASWFSVAAGKGPSWGAGWASDPWQDAGWGTGWLGGKAWQGNVKGGKGSAGGLQSAKPLGKPGSLPLPRQPGKAAAGKEAAPRKAAQKAQPKGSQSRAPASAKRTRSEGSAGDGPTHVGVVKRFNMRVAHGYIECEDIKAETGQDVYVHQNTLAESNVNVGYTVSFQVHYNDKGLPQAAAPLEIIETAEPGTHWGVIKSFVEKQAYGFVECEETKAEYGRDVFLPISKAQGFYVGQSVYFNIDLNDDGMPVVKEMFPAQFELDTVTKPNAIVDRNPEAGQKGYAPAEKAYAAPQKAYAPAQKGHAPAQKGKGHGQAQKGYAAPQKGYGPPQKKARISMG